MAIIQEQGVQPAPHPIRYCRRCHRKLRNEESMKLGFGPVCIKKEVQDRTAQKEEAA